MEASSQAVIRFGCSRGLPGSVPVPGTKPERVKEITSVPVLNGSKKGSPVGTGMSAISPESAGVRSMS